MFKEKMNALKFPIVHVNVLWSDGGIGDCIARLPVLKYIYEQYPHVVLHVWVPDYFLDFAKHFFPKIIIKPYSKAIKEFNDKMVGVNTHCPQVSNMRCHLVDNAFHVLVDKDVEMEHKNYLQLDLSKIDITKIALPKKYIIITTGYTAKVREMKASVVNDLSDYIIFKGYTPVYLGSKVAKTGVDHMKDLGKPDIIGNFSEEIDYNKGLDLIGKTTLLQAGKIIAGAKAIVGVDCGLHHVAGCTEVPIIAAYPTVEPKYRMPYRYNFLGAKCYPIVPPKELDCRWCQSKFNFVFDFDFRNCYKKDRCEAKSIECVDMLTTDLYTKELEKIL